MSTFSNSLLRQYYETHAEDERFSTRHGSVEFLTTLRYIEKYVRPGDRIIEIGAGTGRYSHELARRGFRVDAVELIPRNIEIFRENTKPGESVTVSQGNALDLSAFESEKYDLTLLLGPLYHLYSEKDQRRALQEALRVTKSGGILFCAYCGNDACVLQACFERAFLLNPRYQALTDPATFKLSSTPEEIFSLNRIEEIEELTALLPADRICMVGTDMFAHYKREMLDSMPDELFEQYLRYHFSICERRDMIGISNHFLDILKKR